MHTRQLEYFMAVASDRSFSRAALRLGISQSGLSRQIKKLESDLGVTLFDRSSNTVALTRAGQTLLEKAGGAVQIIQEAISATREASEDGISSLRVGFMPQTLDSFLSAAISSCRRKHDHIRFELHELNPGSQLEKLRERELDVAFLGSTCPGLEKEFDLFAIGDLKLGIMVALDHLLAGEGSVPLSALEKEVFISLKQESYPGRKVLIEQLCANQGFSPDWSPRVADGLGSMMALVSSNHGIAIAPREVIRLARNSVGLVDFSDGPFSITLQAAVAPNEARKSIRLFLEECRQQFLQCDQS